MPSEDRESAPSTAPNPSDPTISDPPDTSGGNPPTDPSAPRAVRPQRGPAGLRARLRANALWRMKSYLRPYVPRLALIWFAAAAGTGVSIAIPMVSKEVIDGPIADGD